MKVDIPLHPEDFKIVNDMLKFDYRNTGAYNMARNLEDYLGEAILSHGHDEPVQAYMREYIATLQEFRKAYYPMPSSNRGQFHDPAHRGENSSIMESWGLELPVEKIRPNMPIEERKNYQSARHLPKSGVHSLRKGKSADE